MQPMHRTFPQQQQAAPLSNAQHRGGDWRNEIPLGNPPVPLEGGPHHGQIVHQPTEVNEVELRGPDGQLHVYRAEGTGAGRRFVHAGEAVPPPPSASDLAAENAQLRAQLEALQAKA